MLTRCPACGTTFRLRADLIAKAHGRVRCGQCQTPFSAIENRLDSEGDEDTLPVPDAPDTRPPPLPAATPQFSTPGQRKRFLAQRDSAADRADVEAAIAASGDITLPPELPAETDGPPAPASGDAPTPATEAPAPEAGDVAPPATSTSAPATTSDGPADDAGGDSVESAASGEPDSEEDVPDEGADEQHESAEAGENADGQPIGDYLAPAAPARRWPWAAGAALLAAALGLQLVHAYRTDIAKHHPGWRPALESMCAVFGCAVELPRDADQVSIVSSELNPESDKSRLRLEAHIKNRAAYAQDYPDLELTLTDVRDQPVLRRVFEPKDYLTKEAAASFAPNSEVVVKLLLDIGDSSASGYRVYVFYP